MSHWKFIDGKEEQWYFLTMTVIEYTYIFTAPEYFEIIIESLSYCKRHKELRLAGYIIMPNHLHLICAGSLVYPLSDSMRDFKHFTANKILDKLHQSHRWKEISIFCKAALEETRGNKHRFWMEGCHPILVETERMFNEKLHYLHDNPVRKGFIEFPEQWKYSSARNYLTGDHSILPLECVE